MENTNFFKGNFANVADLKQTYKKLCLQLHPDKGGDHETFVKMGDEYERLLKTLINKENSESNYTKWDFDLEKSLMEKINSLMIFSNINIEIIGSWLWIDGDTKPIRSELGKLGFRWSSNKKKWHFGTTKKKTKKKFTLDQIRDLYGSEKLKSTGKKTPVLE
jgi:hypothetical protein